MRLYAPSGALFGFRTHLDFGGDGGLAMRSKCARNWLGDISEGSIWVTRLEWFEEEKAQNGLISKAPFAA